MIKQVSIHLFRQLLRLSITLSLSKGDMNINVMVSLSNHDLRKIKHKFCHPSASSG
jgi:hypothetical protein